MNTTNTKVDILLEKFQEVFNLVTDLQEELEQEKEGSLTPELLEQICNEVQDFLEGTSFSDDGSELSMDYNNTVIVDEVRCDFYGIGDDLYRELRHHLPRKTFKIKYQIKLTPTDKRRNVHYFELVETQEGTTVSDAMNSVRNSVHQAIRDLSSELPSDESKDLLGWNSFPDLFCLTDYSLQGEDFRELKEDELGEGCIKIKEREPETEEALQD